MTRKEVISDSAQFDERVFPGTSKTPVDLRVKEVENLLEQGGVEIEDVLPAPLPAPSTMPTPDPTPGPSRSCSKQFLIVRVRWVSEYMR